VRGRGWGRGAGGHWLEESCRVGWFVDWAEHCWWMRAWSRGCARIQAHNSLVCAAAVVLSFPHAHSSAPSTQAFPYLTTLAGLVQGLGPRCHQLCLYLRLAKDRQLRQQTRCCLACCCWRGQAYARAWLRACEKAWTLSAHFWNIKNERTILSRIPRGGCACAVWHGGRAYMSLLACVLAAWRLGWQNRGFPNPIPLRCTLTELSWQMGRGPVLHFD